MAEVSELINELKLNSITFPCGLEVVSKEKMFKNISTIRCPLHGKDCVKKEVRIIGELKK